MKEHQSNKNIYELNIKRAIHFLEENLDKKILLKDVAQEANLSQFHFHRIFKSIVGETTKDYLQRLQIERSAIKLKHTQYEINQIASECGFNNTETFIRAFKRYFSVTPAAYRQAINEIVIQKQINYEVQNIDLSNLQIGEPVIKVIPDLHLAYVRHVGSYDKVASSFQRLMFWSAKNLVLKWVPTTLGIVHDNPELTDEEKIRFDACVLVSKPIKPNGEVSYKKIEGGKFALFTYKGPYENFHTVYDYVFNVCLFKKGWELADNPALEWYVKSPPFYKPQNFVTNFYVPIK